MIPSQTQLIHNVPAYNRCQRRRKQQPTVPQLRLPLEIDYDHEYLKNLGFQDYLKENITPPSEISSGMRMKNTIILSKNSM